MADASDETGAGVRGPGSVEMFCAGHPRWSARSRVRYLRSRRASGRVSLDHDHRDRRRGRRGAALIVVLGVMNGLRNDLRERILVANPHLRILTYGNGLRLENWRPILEQVRKEPGVIAAAPEVLSQSVISAGADYAEGVNVLGFDPDTGTSVGHYAPPGDHPGRSDASRPPATG